MNNLQIKIFSKSNEILKTVTMENLADAVDVIDGDYIRLFAGNDDMGYFRDYYGNIRQKWIESNNIRDRYEQITLTRQAIDGRYTDEQQSAISEYLTDRYHDEDCLECRKSNRMFCYNDNLVQVFAVFGGIARQLIAFHDHDDNIIFPLIIDGQCLNREFTGDEGSAGGVAHLFYQAKKQKWSVVEIDRLQWLYTDELTMSRQDVTDRIVTEIEMGHNALFPKPAGWA